MSDEPWFVRRRNGLQYTINPRTWQGWAMTAGYVASTLAITPLAQVGHWYGWSAWGAALAAETIVFVTMAWRLSVPMKENGDE